MLNKRIYNISLASIYRLQSTVESSEKGFHLIVLKTGHSGLRGVYDSSLASFVLELKDIHDIHRATPTNAFGTLKQIARPEGHIISKIDNLSLTASCSYTPEYTKYEVHETLPSMDASNMLRVVSSSALLSWSICDKTVSTKEKRCLMFL